MVQGVQVPQTGGGTMKKIDKISDVMINETGTIQMRESNKWRDVVFVIPAQVWPFLLN
jgi:hypothetical protein